MLKLGTYSVLPILLEGGYPGLCNEKRPFFPLVAGDEVVLLDGQEACTFSPYTDEDPGDLIALWLCWLFDHHISKASIGRAFTSAAFLAVDS